MKDFGRKNYTKKNKAKREVMTLILTKSIIDEMVSYIDFADIRAFVQNHPELVTEEEKKQIFTIGSIVTGVIIQKTTNLEFITI